MGTISKKNAKVAPATRNGIMGRLRLCSNSAIALSRQCMFIYNDFPAAGLRTPQEEQLIVIADKLSHIADEFEELRLDVKEYQEEE